MRKWQVAILEKNDQAIYNPYTERKSIESNPAILSFSDTGSLVSSL